MSADKHIEILDQVLLVRYVSAEIQHAACHSDFSVYEVGCPLFQVFYKVLFGDPGC